jgi:His-Xaa-Ser repeat protein HxsA
MMVVRVQAALMRLGYYNGDIDGLLGPMTRDSITRFQTDRSLAKTGRMDIETLTALGIPVQ